MSSGKRDLWEKRSIARRTTASQIHPHLFLNQHLQPPDDGPDWHDVSNLRTSRWVTRQVEPAGHRQAIWMIPTALTQQAPRRRLTACRPQVDSTGQRVDTGLARVCHGAQPALDETLGGSGELRHRQIPAGVAGTATANPLIRPG